MPADSPPAAGPWVCLLRHGESEWNRQNMFTGWTDVDLSELGVLQAKRAGNVLKAHGYTFDLAFTSVLKRAVRTLWLMLDEMDLLHLPDLKSWRLNERHYGALQGLNKAETAKQYGDEQVHEWRRSYAVRPPALDNSDPRHPQHDCRYWEPTGLPAGDAYLPATESLEDCVHRTLPFWQDVVVPAIRAGKRVVVAAHGNSLRGIVKHLDQISEQDIMGVEIPVGTPLIYELDPVTLLPVRKFYLGEPQIIRSATSDTGSLLVHPSSWGLLGPVGKPVSSWLSDLARVGLIRPLGIMQWTDAAAATSDAPTATTGVAVAVGSVGGVADLATVSQQSVASPDGFGIERLESEMQARQLACRAGALKLEPGAAAPAGPGDLARANTASTASASLSCAPATVEGCVQLDDLPGLLQHSRFVVLDLDTASSAQPLATLTRVAHQLDPAQHTLLLVTRRSPHMFVEPTQELLKEAIGALGIRVLAVQLPDAVPTAEDVAILAARSTTPSVLTAQGPASQPAGSGSKGPSPSLTNACPNLDEGAMVMGVSLVVTDQDVDVVRLLLQYTGRSVQVARQ